MPARSAMFCVILGEKNNNNNVLKCWLAWKTYQYRFTCTSKEWDWLKDRELLYVQLINRRSTPMGVSCSTDRKFMWFAGDLGMYIAQRFQQLCAQLFSCEGVDGCGGGGGVADENGEEGVFIFLCVLGWASQTFHKCKPSFTSVRKKRESRDWREGRRESGCEYSRSGGGNTSCVWGTHNSLAPSLGGNRYLAFTRWEHVCRLHSVGIEGTRRLALVDFHGAAAARASSM